MSSVILVEPEIPKNTGFIARLCSNFNFDLRLVNPNFNLAEAKNTANNAQQILDEAIIFDDVEASVEDLDFVIGTKPGKGVEASKFTFRENVSIMLGRESSGLTNEELDLCDALVHLDADYSSLNLSHAASILMYRSYVEASGRADSGRMAKVEEKCSDIEAELIKRSSPTREELDRLLGEL
jgi:TrmH family RNA methyltransferase